jgi:hypothetical protein
MLEKKVLSVGTCHCIAEFYTMADFKYLKLFRILFYSQAEDNGNTVENGNEAEKE